MRQLRIPTACGDSHRCILPQKAVHCLLCGVQRLVGRLMRLLHGGNERRILRAAANHQPVHLPVACRNIQALLTRQHAVSIGVRIRQHACLVRLHLGIEGLQEFLLRDRDPCGGPGLRLGDDEGLPLDPPDLVAGDPGFRQNRVDGGLPILTGQVFNIVATFLVAWLMFGVVKPTLGW